MTEQCNLALSAATDVLQKLTTGELTSAAVHAAVKRQTDAVNPGINAFDSIVDNPAPRHAGPLCGLPISVKDQIHVAGLPCNFGLDKPAAGLCPDTASPVQRLLNAGASVIGKTNLPPFAMDFQSFNNRAGRTNNPWHAAYTTGGSSGGSAAAVAAGMSYLDVGADLAGSLRMPAAYCGVYSLLPTEHTLPSDGMLAAQGALAHFARMGPLARSVEDLMLAWRYLSTDKPRGTDDTAARKSVANNGQLKLALWVPGEGELIDQHTAAAFAHAQRVFATAADIDVETTRGGCIINAEAHRCYGEIMGYETGALMPPVARWLGRLFGAAAARRSPMFLTHVHAGQAQNKTRYAAALLKRQQLQAQFDSRYAEADVLLLPVSRISCFKHRMPDSDRNGIRDYAEPFCINGCAMGYLDAVTSFTTPISLVGNPVVTVPLCLDSRGLPVGGQLVGRRGQEWQLLAAARRLAALLPPPVWVSQADVS